MRRLLDLGGGLRRRCDPVQDAQQVRFRGHLRRTTVKPALYRPFEGVIGRHHRPADDFPCPKHRGSKPVLDKSDIICHLLLLPYCPLRYPFDRTSAGEYFDVTSAFHSVNFVLCLSMARHLLVSSAPPQMPTRQTRDGAPSENQ